MACASGANETAAVAGTDRELHEEDHGDDQAGGDGQIRVRRLHGAGEMRAVERQLKLVVREMVIHESSHDEERACCGECEGQLVDGKELPARQVQKQHEGQGGQQKHGTKKVLNDVHAPVGLLVHAVRRHAKRSAV